MRILFVNKSATGDGTPTDDVLNVFENSDDMEEIKDAVEGAAERLLATWASVDMKDKEGELIPINDIISQQETLLERNGPISDTHTNKIVGQTLAFKVLENPKSKTLGVLHLQKFWSDYEIDDKIWGEIVSGERKGSSVGGYRLGMSKGEDPVTGDPVNVLDDFRHLETASVEDPCNPLALNEAFSVVAKSNSTNLQKPFGGYKDFSDCVSQNQDKDNPEAYCGSIQAVIEKEETVISKQLNNDINKVDSEKDITGETMEKNTLKQISDISAAVTKQGTMLVGLQKAITALTSTKKQEDEPEEVDEKKTKKQDEPDVVVEEPETVDEKKTKKAEHEEDEPVEEKKTKKQDEEDEVDESKVKKEEAASDIDGLTDAEIPEEPLPEDSNQEDSFKKLTKQLVKKVAVLEAKVKKVMTPMPGAADVNKANDFAAKPLAIAKGELKITMDEANRAHKENMQNIYGGGF